MGAARVYLATLLALSSAVGCDAFYFFLQSGHTRCFQEDLQRKRSVIHMDYKFGSGIASSPVKLEVLSPRGKSIFSGIAERDNGTFQANSFDEPGQFSICLRLQDTGGGSNSMRVSLDVQVHVTNTGDWVEHKDPSSGRMFYHNPSSKESSWKLPQGFEDGVRIANVASDADSPTLGASKQELEMYENYMEAIEAVMMEIHDDAITIMEVQTEFKGEADSTSSLVFWMALVQLAICAIVPAVQTWQMKRILVSKKLV